MVEQDAVDGIHPVSLPVIACDPVRIHLGGAIRTSWMEWCVFILRWRSRSKHLGAGGLVETAVESDHSDSLQEARGPEARRVASELGLIEADPNVRLSTEMVNLVGLDSLQQRHQA